MSRALSRPNPTNHRIFAGKRSSKIILYGRESAFRQLFGDWNHLLVFVTNNAKITHCFQADKIAARNQNAA